MGEIRMTHWHLVLFAVMIATATYCGQFLSLIADPGPPAIWPASGIYFAFLFASRIQDWWKLALIGLIASLFADFLALKPLMPWMWFAKTPIFFAGIYVTRRLIGRHRDDFHRNGLAFVVVGAILTPAVFSLFSAMILNSLGLDGPLLESWRFHFAGTSLGILTLTPFLLTSFEWSRASGSLWQEVKRRWRLTTPAKFGLDLGLFFASVLLTQYVFSGIGPDPLRSPFFVYSLIICVAFRGKQELTATTNLAVSLVILWNTLHHRGLAAGFPDWTDGLAVLQLLLAVMILTGMILTSVVQSRNVANAALAEAKQKADEASRAKSAFLANMSHEIRSPLSAMIGFAELIAMNGSGDGESRAHAEIIRRNGTHLHELINQILDLSKVEAGRLEAQLESVDVRELVHEVAALMEVKTKEKGLTLKVDVTPSTPRRIVSDPLRLHQILLNVVGNSIKFTATGRVEVRVDAAHVDGRWRVTIDVEDTGIGLTPDEASRLFVVFSQADATVARRYGGTGLGLALSRRLARLLGGDMQLLTSAKGSGSTFRIWVDGGDHQLAIVEADRIPTANGRTDALQGLRVLLADDSADSRLLVQRFLHLAGAGVHSVENGRDAVSAAFGQAFDLILMDIEMPEMDGLEAVRRLRHQGYKGKVVALTGRGMDGEIEEILSSGFDGHLVKPIDRHALIEFLRRYVTAASGSGAAADRGTPRHGRWPLPAEPEPRPAP